MKLTMYQMDAVRVAQRALREELAAGWPFRGEPQHRVGHRAYRKALKELARALPDMARIALIPVKGRK